MRVPIDSREHDLDFVVLGLEWASTEVRILCDRLVRGQSLTSSAAAA